MPSASRRKKHQPRRPTGAGNLKSGHSGASWRLSEQRTEGEKCHWPAKRPEVTQRNPDQPLVFSASSADKKGVLRDPQRPSVVQKEGFYAVLRGPPRTKEVAVAVLRGPLWPSVDKRSCRSPCPSVSSVV